MKIKLHHILVCAVFSCILLNGAPNLLAQDRRTASWYRFGRSTRAAERRRSLTIWERRKPSQVFLFRDLRARRVRDLVTIVVRENTDVQNKDKRALEKDTEKSSNVDVTTSTGGDLGTSAATLTTDGTVASSSEFDATSEFSSEREFTDRITVTVLRVMPSGNLLVGGKRRILVEGDQKILTVSGIIRPLDISADNTVDSRFVANFDVKYQGTGSSSRNTRQGWLNRVVSRVWPF